MANENNKKFIVRDKQSKLPQTGPLEENKARQVAKITGGNVEEAPKGSPPTINLMIGILAVVSAIVGVVMWLVTGDFVTGFASALVMFASSGFVALWNIIRQN